MGERRAISAASIIMCVVAMTQAGAPPAPALAQTPLTATRPGPCPLARVSTETVQAYAARVIACAAGIWSVPGGVDRAICIARRESGLNPAASSPNGDYLGLFQHSAKYWPARYAAWTRVGWQLRPSALNARTNAVVTLRMVHAAGRWSTAGWSPKGC